ncbi:2-succinyl-5-enolpyruvyl-6-hydroxy-3-cyclohexene-1-carboxylate synthase [Providencia alcalifaciens]|uniref:Thiamine pyrophosphate binding domain-containing protein n=1 Tax=Providencia alcalifaciens TaxID=126385 RepID=A0A346CL51_9GAMM|nr:thiamine pyrophosphate-binding protein [Providencia alcalifaciens]AXL96325.1 thiamine pyrophosphate binding domain-containing protein [Providencia alcalifaciens]MTC38696.1 2-succinyl-5-enolpyruvyl-6-hydroxy-3-cyclohexene-1-carboxylate synthase [Providencia alcalifaciens]
MKFYSTTEKNALIVISLLKAHGVRYIIASPGNTNTAFIGSIQKDPFFKIFSAVDERSAAYMACGLSAETGEPVVISCTGATASRNYAPGMTEAYYRKLPVLALTSTQPVSRIGHHVAQVIDRSIISNDIANLSVTLPVVKDEEDFWDCEIKVNRAILELTRRGGGPVHINLPTTYSLPFTEKEGLQCKVINRFYQTEALPAIDPKKRVSIIIGSHHCWSEKATLALEDFCNQYNAVVFCDHTSGYKGKNRVLISLAAAQEIHSKSELKSDITLHIGEVTGDYPLATMSGNEVWRISPDGEIRDTFRKLRYVFEMPEISFFQHYAEQASQTSTNEYFQQCTDFLKTVQNKIPEVPFSNVWLASKLASRIPSGSAIHFGILNSLRTWNFYDLPNTVTSFSNVGGFGIDGSISSLLGASLANPNKLYYGVIGDLAFFYDLNAIGNRHTANNMRILLVNNGKGTEFRLYNHHASHFGTDGDEFVAAAGHYGNKSSTLIKNYAENLGFEYFSANNKEEFETVYQRFIEPNITEKPMLFEVFTDSEEESKALQIMHRLEVSAEGKAKQTLKKVLGPKGIDTVKKLIKR